MMRRLIVNLVALVIGLSIGMLSVLAFADQPSPTATVSEHLFFLEGQIVVICFWLATIIGAICGFAMARKHDSVNVP